jgi:hypothetical protein
MKPNCYDCQHRRDIAGDAHSRCAHPDLPEPSPLAELLAIFAGVGRAAPVTGQAPFSVRGNATGIARGWFNWPFNFDPTWLEECGGFQVKQQSCRTTSDIKDKT